MIGNIMLGYDDSEPAKKALDYAVDLAAKYGSNLEVVSVVRPPEYLSDRDSLAVVDNTRNVHKRMLEGLSPKFDEAGVNASYQVLVGNPGDQILQHAERANVDLIVVGHTGKTFLEALRMGSVSKQVMQNAPCAVLVVR
ncbi:MAG: universal stress protein [Rhodocyclaceae bacterium]|jgi:nucleotide-binding universal stress UspA family protein